MKRNKKILAIILILSMVVSVAGINIKQHLCSKKINQFTSIALSNQTKSNNCSINDFSNSCKCCCKHHDNAHKAKSCCKNKEENQYNSNADILTKNTSSEKSQLKTSKCCLEVSYYKALNSIFLSSLDIITHFTVVSNIVIIINDNIIYNNSSFSYISKSDNIKIPILNIIRYIHTFSFYKIYN